MSEEIVEKRPNCPAVAQVLERIAGAGCAAGAGAEDSEAVV